MGLQFRRIARLEVGSGADLLEINELRIAFEVNKSRLAGVLPNSATIRVYNLKRETRAKLGERTLPLFLFAGYEGEDELVYGGEVRRVLHEREGPTWVSIFYCDDSYKKTQERTICRTFPSGTAVREILQRVAGSFGTGDVEIVVDDLGAIKGSRTVCGGSRQVLEGLSEEYGFDWSFQDTRLEISSPDKTFDDESVVISPDTGMVGQPVVTDAGIEVTTLLNPRLRVKRKVRVESRAASIQVTAIAQRDIVPILEDGDYVVAQVVFTGDTWGAEWTSRIKTLPPGVEFVS